MSDKLPRVTARKVIGVLERLGFVLVRQSGSHAIYKNAAGVRAAGVRITVPVHSKKILHPKVLKGILKDTGLSVDDFRQLMK